MAGGGSRPRPLGKEAGMSVLEKRDHTHADPRVRLKAVEKTTDPDTLVQLACTDDSQRVRLAAVARLKDCLLYTSPSPRDRQKSRMPSSA
jgi:hypothetical protein